MIRNSIRNKLILFLLAATILPISTSIVMTYYVTERQVIQDTIQTNSNLIYQGKTNLVNYLNGVKQATLLVYNDNNLYTVIENGATGFGSRQEIIRGLLSINNAVQEIHQVYLYLSKTDKAFLYTQGNTNSNESSRSKYVPSVDKGNVWIEPTHSSHTYAMFPFNPLPTATVFTFHRSITNSLTMEDLGTLSVDVNVSFIESICNQLMSQGEELFVLDAGGNVVYGSKAEYRGKMLDEPWVRDLLAREEERGSLEWNGGGFSGIQMYERIREPYADWIIVKRIPNELLYEHAKRLTFANTLILLAFMAVVIIGTVIVSIRFTAPIRKLLGYIGKIQTGNMQVDIHVKGNDEFSILAHRFRVMMQTINQLITKEYKLEIANKTNQLKALQAQINPHFLYNALQSIGTLALQHEAPKIYSLLSALAKIMRYSMNTGEPIVPFKREVDHVRSYLALQLHRFENELTVEYRITDEAAEIPVPKMILQPLVENYFKHGFDPRSQIGRLEIGGRLLEGNRLEITVADNGKGMSAHHLEQLRRKLRLPMDASGEEDGIGLLNVLARLKLYYDDEAAMIVEPHQPGGLIITIIIPLQRKEADEDDRHDR
ncbi:cache domain-containing sensor histidine kinase [Paenibacillus validus]|uniref:cache domain-containing sensor histidine kinase n=1 Tax=Paenibacillus validus TaxID=44253 RepID=UPI003D27B727